MTPERRLLRHEERQAQLLRAAATAFAGSGFSGTSMDDVAAEAGVTRLIIYRHFGSKEILYRSVLERVTDRLQSEFGSGIRAGTDAARGWIVASMLTVARENPDGFRLLTVHAAREPGFAALHDQWWARAVGAAETLVGDSIADPALRAWATRTIVAYLVDAVLNWLDTGTAGRDPEFVQQAHDGLVAMYLAWADPASSVVRRR